MRRISAFELLITTFALCFAFLSVIAVPMVFGYEDTMCTDCSTIFQCPSNVGGEVVSVNKFDLIAPYIGLGLILATPPIASIAIKHIKRRKKR